MKVLTVTADVPWPTVGGARTRNASLVRALAAEHDVTVAALDWGGPGSAPPDGIALHTVPWELPPLHAAAEAGDADAWEQLWAPDAEPYGVSYYASPGFEAQVTELCEKTRPDVVVLTETATARFRTALPAGVPYVLDLHDVQTVKQAEHAAEARRIRHFEAAAAAGAAVTVCVSALEAAAAREVLGARRVEVVPNGVDTSWFVPQPGAGDDDRLVFTGSLHTDENVEGVGWFVEHVLPRVRAQRPGVVLDVVGSRPRDQVRRLVGDGVRLHADVPDTRPFLAAAGVAVVPLLHGGGTRLKVLEAGASARSIVTTSVGVEGLALHDGAELDVADDPDAFADAVVRLCADPGLRAQRATAAQAAAAAYDWTLVGSRWAAVLESVVESGS